MIKIDIKYKDYLLSEIGSDFVTVGKSHITIPATNYTKQDCYDLGVTLSKAYELEEARKPEEIWLPSESAGILQEAIKLVEKEQMITCNSIHFYGENKSSRIVIHPTEISFLFAVLTKYGKLCKEHELKKGGN